MRIISGRWKGRHLSSFKADHIRPTTDRVKESLFNRLMGEVEGSKVLDLYSGTGNLALEALSRGAANVEVVESHPKSLTILRKNWEDLGRPEGFLIHKSDVFKFLTRFKGEPFDLILVDPPFTEKLAHSTLEALAQSEAVGTMTTIVIESSRHERVDKSYGTLVMISQKSFGDKDLSFFRRQVDAE